MSKLSSYVVTVRAATLDASAFLTIGAQCMEAAFALLDLWLNYMHSIGHTPYAPDFFFVGTGFAAAFLLEVCFSSFAFPAD